jgi:hypothetical protein
MNTYKIFETFQEFETSEISETSDTLETFTELFDNLIEENLAFYPDTVSSKFRDETMQEVIYLIELEFNEEREITIDIVVPENFVLNAKDIFHLLVVDALHGNYESFDMFCDDQGYGREFSSAFHIYQHCKHSADKLLHLIGQNLFDRFMNCNLE